MGPCFLVPLEKEQEHIGYKLQTELGQNCNACMGSQQMVFFKSMLLLGNSVYLILEHFVQNFCGPGQLPFALFSAPARQEEMCNKRWIGREHDHCLLQP